MPKYIEALGIKMKVLGGGRKTTRPDGLGGTESFTVILPKGVAFQHAFEALYGFFDTETNRHRTYLTRIIRHTRRLRKQRELRVQLAWYTD